MQVPSVLVVSQERDSPLHLAAAKGNLGVAKLLVKSGADVTALNAVQPTPLHNVGALLMFA